MFRTHLKEKRTVNRQANSEALLITDIFMEGWTEAAPQTWRGDMLCSVRNCMEEKLSPRELQFFLCAFHFLGEKKNLTVTCFMVHTLKMG